MDDDDYPGDYPGGWFGPSWGAPVNEGPHRKVPDGTRCSACKMKVSNRVSGMVVPHLSDPVVLSYYHLGCWYRALGIEQLMSP